MYRQLFRLGCITLCCVVLFSINASAQIIPGEGMDSGLGGNNTLTGTVVGPSGQRVTTRIRIRLTTMTRGDRVGTTDENGNFVFRGLVSGSYSIVINEKEFEPVSQNVEIIQLRGSPPQTLNVNIRLTLKNDPLPKPGVVDASLKGLDQKGKDLFSRAQDLAKGGDHLGAIKELLQLTKDFSTFMSGFNELGVEYLRTGENEKASNAFEAALKLEPEAFAPRLNSGIALYTLKQFDKAEAELRKAVSINQDSPPAHYFLGQSIANLGKFEEAEKELLIALKAASNSFPEAHRTLAIIYTSRKDSKNAVAHLEEYIKLVPQAPDVEQLRSLAAKLKGQ